MSLSFEVPEPIINSPYREPVAYWYIREGETPKKRSGRRPAMVFPPREQSEAWLPIPGIIQNKLKDYPSAFELALVNQLRASVAGWREQGWPGASRTTDDLLRYWRRDERHPRHRLFFAQLEAAETIIFLTEARADFLQGINIPRDEPSEEQRQQGYAGFSRLALKMATGTGKTTVMAMLAAWSILNKTADKSDARFSDAVLVVCPNVTIRSRLAELDPNLGDASLYRTRDLVPQNMMSRLLRGKVLVVNWHVFIPQTPQTGGVSAKVNKTGTKKQTTETITIGAKSTTARGTRYLSLDDLNRQIAAGMLEVVKREYDADGSLKKVKVNAERYIESDAAMIRRVFAREFGGRKNILVMNDEAHHAYRIVKAVADESDSGDEEEDRDELDKEATVWVEGLDRMHRMRGINRCIDLSATPFFLGRIGQETNKPFPWLVSDFGLIEAIESGMVKIPQLAVRDTTGAEIPGYFNIWNWILDKKLTPAERGSKKGGPKPEAILKYANTPIAMLGSLWEEYRQEKCRTTQDQRSPVFIIVCKNTKIAKLVYEWIAENNPPTGIPPSKIEGWLNQDGQVNTIRVDSRVVHETDTGEAKSDETRWMRLTLDTIGKREWPVDRQGRPCYPPDFEKLATKLHRPLHPPGRDVRCIVSVGMLTEGWDCTTVSHVIGLRPFMSQLLCEQVVGRGLRRSDYGDFNEETQRFPEEVAKVLGVPFEVIPFKATKQPKPPLPTTRTHVHALPERENYEIVFPRVEGYTQAIRNRLVVHWHVVAPLTLEPGYIPPEVEVKGLSMNNLGRPSLNGPGELVELTLRQFRAKHRLQELIFDLAGALTRSCLQHSLDKPPAHVLFPQIVAIVRRYVTTKVHATPPAEVKDLFMAPYYGWLLERLRDAIQPDTAAGEAPEVPIYEQNRGPGSTCEVDCFTSRDERYVRPTVKSHVNYMVADTGTWEQIAATYIDKHDRVAAFVKNFGLGFTIPYFHDGRRHDYFPDFIIRLTGEEKRFLILEVKGFDMFEEVKRAAAHRWINAVNAEGSHGVWRYEIAKKPEEVNGIIEKAGRE